MIPNRSEIEARSLAMQETTKPAWFVFNTFSSIEIHANRAGFEFLGNKLLEMAGAAPDEEAWLPTDSSVIEMGPPVFLLRMAGEKPPKPLPPLEPNSEEQLRTSRAVLVAKAASALHAPPNDAD